MDDGIGSEEELSPSEGEALSNQWRIQNFFISFTYKVDFPKGFYNYFSVFKGGFHSQNALFLPYSNKIFLTKGVCVVPTPTPPLSGSTNADSAATLVASNRRPRDDLAQNDNVYHKGDN
jgi:hypothetical protein